MGWQCSNRFWRGLADSSMRNNQARSVYLITYSQADEHIVHSRERFADIIKAAFLSVNCTILQWVCSCEPHAVSGVHYHLALKLNKVHRWLGVRKFLCNTYNINVNFSGNHCNYYTAWQYVIKEDVQYIQSINHPDLRNNAQPRTTSASMKRVEQGLAGDDQPVKKRRRLSAFDV